MATSMLVIEHADNAPVARLGEWLADAGAELDVRRPHRGESLPEALGGYSALVVMGGGMNALDDRRAPWLPATRHLLATAVREELPVLGVCLGAQLLAAATGGRVGLGTAPEYGAQLIAKRQAAAADPLLRELPITPDVVHWHTDEVAALPPNAVQLASGPACEQQAFRVGRCAWGIQFHIETTPEIVRQWAAEDAAELAGYDLDGIVERCVAVHPDLAEVWAPVAARFVEIARDPAAAGGPRNLPLAGRAVSTAAPITDPAAIRAALAAEMQAAHRPPSQ
ncbi:MAG TPA: type 1 glutamine amidotransferase [Jatrophihabitans sp.]|nr:type 1 glutamine amidotransferase [Jatrophihabitans sp.]